MLGVTVRAVLAGARSYLAVAEWARDLTPTRRVGLLRQTRRVRRAREAREVAWLEETYRAWA